MVHARRQPGERDGRYRRRPRLLLAGGHRRLARAAVLIGITSALAWVNVRGIRQSAWVVNALTIGKLLPLALFIGVGLFYIEPSRLATLPPISLNQVSTAALLLIFIFGGFDVVGTPAGEAVDPRRDVPFALVTTILAVMTIMTLAQIVAQGVLPDLAPHATPIADAAAVFLGSAGALLVGAGSVVSMTGNNAGQVLSGCACCSRWRSTASCQRSLRGFIRASGRRRTP